jgi:hypothetical protein
VAIWFIFWLFGYFPPFLVCGSKKIWKIVRVELPSICRRHFFVAEEPVRLSGSEAASPAESGGPEVVGSACGRRKSAGDGRPRREPGRSRRLVALCVAQPARDLKRMTKNELRVEKLMTNSSRFRATESIGKRGAVFPQDSISTTHFFRFPSSVKN